MIGYHKKYIVDNELLNNNYIEHTFVFNNEWYIFETQNKKLYLYLFMFIKTFCFNMFYLIYRFIRYGRIIDIETIREYPNYILLLGTYSSNLKYYHKKTDHYTIKLNTNNNKNIKLYFDTWNNLINYKNKNKNKNKNEFNKININDIIIDKTELSRLEVEKKYSINFPWKKIYSSQADNSINLGSIDLS